MKSILLRTASFTLALFLLLGSVSCTNRKPNSEASESGVRLTVEPVPAHYSHEQIASYAARITALCADAVFRAEGIVLNETQRQKLNSTLCDALLPRLAEIPVYPEETDAVLSALEETASGSESEGGLLPLRFYQSSLSIVGSTRAGQLGYLAVSLWLDSREETCRARYEKYGYSWYLEDAEYYASLNGRMRDELGETGFCAAAEMLTFAASSLVGGVMAEDGHTAYGLSAEELTAILRKQATHFAEISLTEAQWRLVGELLAEAVPDRRNTPVTAVLDALKGTDYFARAGAVMPSLVALYGAFTSKMTPRDVETILWGSDETARMNTVCRVLAACDAELTTFLTAWETNAASADEAERKALEKIGAWGDCQAFLEDCGTADATALRAAIAASASEPTNASAEQVGRTLRAYLATQNPYLYYVLNDLRKE